MLVLHVSDTHIGSSAPRSLPFRYRDVLEAFAETIDIAVREHVDVYLHAGDFFDKAYAPPDTYLVAIKQLKRLRDSGIRVVAIAGQHDLPRRYGMSPLVLLRELGAVDHLAVTSIERFIVRARSGSLEVVAVPYPRRQGVRSASRSFKEGPSILLAHLLLKEVVPQNPDASLETLPQGFDYIALGDYHGYRLFRLRDGTPVVYPGATEVFRRDEWCEGGKSVVLVDLSKREPEIQRIALESVRPWIVGRYSSAQEAIEDVRARAAKLVSEGRKPPLVFIAVEGRRDYIARVSYALDALRRENLVAYYHVEPIRAGRELVGDSVEIASVGESEKLDIPKLVAQVVGSEKLAKLLVELISSPSEQSAKRLIEELKNDPQLLEEAKKLVLRGARPVAASRTGARVRVSRSGKGLMRFLGG